MRLPFALSRCSRRWRCSPSRSAATVSRRVGLATGACSPPCRCTSCSPGRRSPTRRSSPRSSARWRARSSASSTTRTTHRTAWWYGFYVFCGLSTLAKGLLGVGLPAVILLALRAGLRRSPGTRASLGRALALADSDAELPRRRSREGKRPMPVLWAQMFRMRLGTGIGVFFAVARALVRGDVRSSPSVDDEGKTFFVPLLHPRPPQPARRGRAHHHAGRRPSPTSSSRAATPSSPGWRCCPARWRWCRRCGCARLDARGPGGRSSRCVWAAVQPSS